MNGTAMHWQERYTSHYTGLKSKLANQEDQAKPPNQNDVAQAKGNTKVFISVRTRSWNIVTCAQVKIVLM